MSCLASRLAGETGVRGEKEKKKGERDRSSAVQSCAVECGWGDARQKMHTETHTRIHTRTLCGQAKRKSTAARRAGGLLARWLAGCRVCSPTCRCVGRPLSRDCRPSHFHSGTVFKHKEKALAWFGRVSRPGLDYRSKPSTLRRQSVNQSISPVSLTPTGRIVNHTLSLSHLSRWPGCSSSLSGSEA